MSRPSKKRRSAPAATERTTSLTVSGDRNLWARFSWSSSVLLMRRRRRSTLSGLFGTFGPRGGEAAESLGGPGRTRVIVCAWHRTVFPTARPAALNGRDHRVRGGLPEELARARLDRLPGILRLSGGPRACATRRAGSFRCRPPRPRRRARGGSSRGRRGYGREGRRSDTAATGGAACRAARTVCPISSRNCSGSPGRGIPMWRTWRCMLSWGRPPTRLPANLDDPRRARN